MTIDFTNAGILLAVATDGFADTTETVETLNSAKESIQAVAENPGLIRTWLEGLVPDLLNFAFQVLIAAIIYIVGGRIIGMIARMVHRSMERTGADEGVRQFVVPLIKYSLYVILIFVIMGLFGIATTSAVAVLGSAGVAVGLALQGSLSNLAGGVLILLLKPFRVGDYIIEDANKNEGMVSEVSIFYTKLLTADNKLIVIPNGMLSNTSLTNVTNMDKRRVDLVVGIGYEADIRAAKEALLALADLEPARIPEERAVVFVSNLGASSVDIGIRVWVKAENYWEAKWRLTENIKYVLDEKGISIPYQQIDVQIRQ
ncbi:MAG: mechanosensitive ion channel family protein [Roseburia sp.]